MLATQNKGTYIPSIEAEEIYDMSVRGLENIMKYEYVGQIPYSLELIKLRSYPKLFNEQSITKNGKEKFQSDAIINVKFKNKIRKDKEITSFVRGYDSLLNRLLMQYKGLLKEIRKNKKIEENSINKREKERILKTIAYLESKAKDVKGHFKRIKNDKSNPIYHEMKASDLRNHLYTKGITFKGKHYSFYKRTASKSRQSMVLMIQDNLLDKMKKWSHIGLDLSGDVSVASILAYESLVSSSIETVINIDPESIFITGDKFSKFTQPAIEVGNDLKATPNDNAEIENNIWDGQGLIDVSLMKTIGRENKGMILTRQHFWKSCLFNTNLQEYYRDRHKELINPDKECYDSSVPLNYDEWKVKDYFGNWKYVKDILVITTQSSLKFLKIDKRSRMKSFENWCEQVRKDDSVFGVCKSEKPSKYDDKSYTSYQMINTLKVDEIGIEKLSKFEYDYITKLQGVKQDDESFDDSVYIEYLEDKSTLTNAYEMMAEMYKVNPETAHTQMFRDYRSKQIYNYKTKVKGGKMRQEGQYATVVSNPVEMLESVLEGKRKNDYIEHSLVLKSDEIYTILHHFDQEYTLVRNPFNSMHNFHKAKNIHHEIFENYFNFTKNIVVINAVKSCVLDRNNGMDMDSDVVLIFNSKVVNNAVDNTLSERKYPVILNKIKSDPDPQEMTNEVIASTDEKTAKSQRWIGEITNQAQFQVSVMWDIINTEEDCEEKEDKIEAILSNVAKLVVLSGIAIDYSKKVVMIDIEQALRDIRSDSSVKIDTGEVTKKLKPKYKARLKPKFWKYVASGDNESTDYQCPMDLLIKHINGMSNAPGRRNKSLISLFEAPEGKSDDKQIKDIQELVREFNKGVKKINANKDGDKKCTERQTLIEDASNELDDRIAKKTIKKATMYKMIFIVSQCYSKQNNKKTEELSGMAVHLLNTLYRNHPTTFLNLMKK
jgi:hypothetical protein